MHDTVRGLQFRVRVRGPRDGDPVLLLHGFPQHAGMWDRVAPILHDAGLCTIAPDQRGYSPGARPAEIAAYRTSECAADAVALLDTVGAERAHVIGHDWGAMVGWRLAAHHADRVRTFTAISVPHPASIVAALRTDAEQQQRSAYIKLFREEGKAERLVLERGAARLRAMFGDLPQDRIDDYVRPLLEPGALTAALKWYRALGIDGATGPALRPTTYVWGDQDIAIGKAAAHGCVAWVNADYEFVALPGASHWLPDEEPDEVARLALARIATED